MKKFLLLCCITTVIIPESNAQFTRYIVKFKDKGNNPFSLSAPANYLSQKAIDRRTRYGIVIDSTDLPVTPSYVTQINNVPNVTVLNVSKWLNAVSIQTTDANAITTINAFPFVKTVSGLAAKLADNEQETQKNKFLPEESVTELSGQSQRTGQLTGDFFNYGSNSYNEIHLHHGEFLHNIGLRGQGMHIAMLDGGFFNYTSLKAFDSANINSQILSTWDFVSRNATVTDDHPHGMQCLSTIAANIPGQFTGKAPKASFHLFRTEDVASEYPIEEHNWVCGAERADSAGSDIISSSLGYYDFDNAVFNYTYSNMDGNTTMAAIGADLAAKKGIIVFNSAGNEGGNAWHYLVTPSDGDSVVAVGAVSTAGVLGNFSSYGPSGDGQVKPDMASVGVAAMVQTTSNTVGTANGTSFACPNMAGLGSCLWQGFPEYNNMKIIQVLKKAGTKFTAPDDRIGYGIPDLKLAFTNLLTEYATSSAVVNGCNATITWNSKDISAMKYEIERKAPGENSYIKVGQVTPQAGTILSNRSYQFINPLSGVNAGTVSYRIRQIADTSVAAFTAVYIDTANVDINTGCEVSEENLVRVQPNPVSTGTAILVVETSYSVQNMTIQVYDSKGSLLIQVKDSKPAGKIMIELPVEKLSAGKYYISVFTDQKKINTAELIKL